ncbi:MAG: LPXTG cell wall anchor domain-containing protein, partial [Clostridia bacterium]|nr:LPXTG cell wall anchor domain-containing protein [Clostridia bacterium]
EYAEVKPNISFTDGVITETPDNNENNEQEDKEPSSPQTGDNSYIVVWILLSVLSLSALVILGIYRRKEIQ